jgi:TATA-box binding protein (TBP) (component of TFIID and TFIIIB)
MFCIRNIKVSVKARNISLDNVIQVLNENSVKWKNYSNFIIFKINNFTFTIFKKGKQFDNHINITQINSLNKIIKSLLILYKLFKINVISVQIDNIIATGYLNKKINLQSLVESKIYNNIKYNSEVFPGLFIRLKIGTVILFHTGKFVVVGCKDLNSLKCITQNISAHI